MEQHTHMMKFTKFYFLKDKIDYNKIIMFTKKKNLIIVIGSAK